MVEKQEVGRVPDGTGLSSPTEPQERLGPAGFDPSREDRALAFAIALLMLIGGFGLVALALGWRPL